MSREDEIYEAAVAMWRGAGIGPLDAVDGCMVIAGVALRRANLPTPELKRLVVSSIQTLCREAGIETILRSDNSECN